MLSYEEFQLELIRLLEKRYPKANIVRTTQYKFNGVKQGIMIDMPGNIQPIVYPDNLYKGYKRLEDMDAILDNIELALELEKMNGFKNIVKDWNQAKQHIYPYILNMEQNQLCIQRHDYVYKRKLDFAYSVYVELADDDGIACVNVTKDLLRLWKVSEEEAFEIAENNAKYYVKPMKRVIAEYIGKGYLEDGSLEREEMYVVTNATKNRGAAGMFDLHLLRQTAEELQSDFFVLPLSIHEVVLVLEKVSPSKEMLKEMMQQVNQCQMDEDEYLSDNVYYYSRDEQKVSIVEID